MEHVVVGVLALQGAFSKHIAMLQSLGVKAIEVRKPKELASCDALIIPGGESTTMAKQMQFINFPESFREFAKQKPVFGTCAGLILMSREVLSDDIEPFHLLDISIERNAFGRQIESFHTTIDLYLGSGKPHSFLAIFIRAPRIRVIGKEVKILAKYQNEPVLIQQGHHLAASFHPELGSDQTIHAHFLKMIRGKASYGA